MPSQPNRDIDPRDKANLLAVGGTQEDADAWERGDVDFDWPYIADIAAGKTT